MQLCLALGNPFLSLPYATEQRRGSRCPASHLRLSLHQRAGQPPPFQESALCIHQLGVHVVQRRVVDIRDLKRSGKLFQLGFENRQLRLSRLQVRLERRRLAGYARQLALRHREPFGEASPLGKSLLDVVQSSLRLVQPCFSHSIHLERGRRCRKLVLYVPELGFRRPQVFSETGRQGRRQHQSHKW